MTAEEMKQYKAKNLRYKKPIARDMNLDYIRQALDEMSETIYDVQWFTDDDDNLVNALAGDEDEAYEFKMAFSDLAAELNQMQEDLDETWIPECFDELFPAAGAREFGGYLGYDAYEHDYYSLCVYDYSAAEQEAEKRITRLTKTELLDAVGQCLKIYSSFVALQYRYDCLEASLNIIREKNLEGLRLVKAIEEQYEIAETASNHFMYKYEDEVYKLNDMLDEMPQEYWL